MNGVYCEQSGTTWSTLIEALATVDPGTPLLLRKGRHQAPSRFNMQVFLTGEAGAELIGPTIMAYGGSLQGLLISSSSLRHGPALELRGDSKIADCVLSNRQGWAKNANNVLTAALRVGSSATATTLLSCTCDGFVLVEGPHTSFRDSTFSGLGGRACVEVCAGVVACTLTGCTLRDHPGAAVLVRRRACVEIVGTSLERCGWSSIECIGGTVTLKASRVLQTSSGSALVVREGGRLECEDCQVHDNASTGAEACGAATQLLIRRSSLRDGASGVGVLCWQEAQADIQETTIDSYPLAGIDVGDGSSPVVVGNTIRKSKTGILVCKGAGGHYKANRISAAERAGIECHSSHEELHVHENKIDGCDIGILFLAGGGGRCAANRVQTCRVGIELRGASSPEVASCEVFQNRRAGVQVQRDGGGCVRECHIHDNGIVARSSVGVQTSAAKRVGGDGAGVVLLDGACARIEHNRIRANKGCGVFSDNGSLCDIIGNTISDNGGQDLCSRPSSQGRARGNRNESNRAVAAVVVPRQRTPFDWTVGSNLHESDKTMEQRVQEMRKDYEEMAENKEMCAMNMAPANVGGAEAMSAMCSLS